MKKIYSKPVIEVQQLLTEGLMQEGHSNNRPEAKDYQGWIGENEENDENMTSKNLWDE